MNTAFMNTALFIQDVHRGQSRGFAQGYGRFAERGDDEQITCCILGYALIGSGHVTADQLCQHQILSPADPFIKWMCSRYRTPASNIWTLAGLNDQGLSVQTILMQLWNKVFVEAPQYEVYHDTNPSYRCDPVRWIQQREQFERVATVVAKDLSEVFALTNTTDGATWTEWPEVFLHTRSRSTSVGDVIVAPDNTVFMVDSLGFRQIDRP